MLPLKAEPKDYKQSLFRWQLVGVMSFYAACMGCFQLDGTSPRISQLVAGLFMVAVAAYQVKACKDKIKAEKQAGAPPGSHLA